MKILNQANNITLAVHDIFDELPEFMRAADCVFTDLPYNQSLLTNYSNRADVIKSENNPVVFDEFVCRFFECVSEIDPHTVYVEIGKQNVDLITEFIETRFNKVTVFENTYLHNKKNKCYIVAGFQANGFDNMQLDVGGLDEENAIALICARAKFGCIGDLCMGRGLVAKYGARFGRSVVGTELNEKRLAVAVERVKKEVLMA